MTTFHPIPVQDLRPQMATWTVAQYESARTRLLQRAAQHPVILPQVELYVSDLDMTWREVQISQPADNSLLLAVGTVGVLAVAAFVLSPWVAIVPAAIGLAVKIGRSGAFHSHGVGDVESYWHGYNAAQSKGSTAKAAEPAPRRVTTQTQTITEF